MDDSIEKAEVTGRLEIQNGREKEGGGSEGGGEVDFSLVETVDLGLERHVCHLDLEDARDEFRPPRLERRQLCSQTHLLPYQTLVNMAARERVSGPCAPAGSSGPGSPRSSGFSALLVPARRSSHSPHSDSCVSARRWTHIVAAARDSCPCHLVSLSLARNKILHSLPTVASGAQAVPGRYPALSATPPHSLASWVLAVGTASCQAEAAVGGSKCAPARPAALGSSSERGLLHTVDVTRQANVAHEQQTVSVPVAPWGAAFAVASPPVPTPSPPSPSEWGIAPGHYHSTAENRRSWRAAYRRWWLKTC